jgi:hypothetical protein
MEQSHAPWSLEKALTRQLSPAEACREARRNQGGNFRCIPLEQANGAIHAQRPPLTHAYIHARAPPLKHISTHSQACSHTRKPPIAHASASAPFYTRQWQTPLHDTAREGDVGRLEELLAAGAEANALDWVSAACPLAFLPLASCTLATAAPGECCSLAWQASKGTSQLVRIGSAETSRLWPA